jgi:hypothetical protein
MVREFGIQIALTPSGHFMRRQFFAPRRFLRDMPMRSQMVFVAPPIPFRGDNLQFWTNPFHFTIDGDFCLVKIKNVSLAIPISRDRRTPVAQHLPFAPSKFTLRPDFGTIFD